MRLLLHSTLLALVAVASTGSAQAQSSMPEKMPFDIPYGAPITLASARKLVAAAEVEATKRGWKEAIAIVDPAGDLVFFEKMDGTMAAAAGIAPNKARTAARFRRPTALFFHAMETGHPYVATLDPNLVASPGGLPLIEKGKIIGAIGCSGGTGGQDEVICQAGADAVH